MSLPLQTIGNTWLSPVCSEPSAWPRRTSARRKNATVGVDDVLVIVTTVVSRPPGAGWLTSLAVTDADGRFCRPNLSRARWHAMAIGRRGAIGHSCAAGNADPGLDQERRPARRCCIHSRFRDG